MAQPKKSSRPTSRLSVVAFAVLFALLGAACEDFYSDSLPTPQIALPTPVNLQEGDPEDLVEAGARTAMAAALGISADAPRKILLQHATWTDRAPGCYPPPPGVSGPYLVPGYRLLMQYEGVFYEYDADLGGETGALCDFTTQWVSVEPALDIVTVNLAGSARPDFFTVYILRSEEDVAEFNSTNSEIATIAVGVVDWTVEVLVGGWVKIGPYTEAVRAYHLPAVPQARIDAAPIFIEVAVPENLADTANNIPSQTWVLIDITRPDSTYQFIGMRQ
ncbi:MAG: hypothetical protein IH960_06590 [Chloroflexi bacterium]|nr:hypothetical protein [Chloroflexota bacterium]